MTDMPTKYLGKIECVSFGSGGYQDAMVGISFTLSGEGWGVCDFWGDWGIERSEHARWTEEDRIKRLGTMVMRINALLIEAKRATLDKLKGVPIEATFDVPYGKLISWRVLKEVL